VPISILSSERRIDRLLDNRLTPFRSASRDIMPGRKKFPAECAGYVASGWPSQEPAIKPERVAFTDFMGYSRASKAVGRYGELNETKRIEPGAQSGR